METRENQQSDTPVLEETPATPVVPLLFGTDSAIEPHLESFEVDQAIIDGPDPAYCTPEDDSAKGHCASCCKAFAPCSEETIPWPETLQNTPPNAQVHEKIESGLQESDEDSGRGDLLRIPEVAGVRLTRRGQVFFVPVEKETIRLGTKVLVELEQGVALTEVVSIFYQDQGVNKAVFPLDGRIIGFATAKDIAAHAENKLLADEAEAFCKTCIRQRSLDMKQVDVVVLHDRSKIIFFFTAPSRIDFRELVKDLVRCYRTRIELRQIGVRHETQMLGGIGNCGRVCCCHNYLRKFAPVTIKMAKEQNLFLNPAKLSGLCGRLLCCLSFEQANYEEFNRRCPRLGKRYATDEGMVRIVRNNLFSQTIVVQADGEDEKEYTLDAFEALHPKRQEKSERPDHKEPHGAAFEEGPPEAYAEKRSRKHAHHSLPHSTDGHQTGDESLAALETLEDAIPLVELPLLSRNDVPYPDHGKTEQGRNDGQPHRPRANRPPHKSNFPNRPKRKRST